MTMSEPHRMKILIQAQYRRWKKSLKKILGGIDMTDINIKVSEEVYLKLSAEAEETEMSIGDYCSWMLSETLPELGELVKTSEEVIESQAKTIEGLRKEIEDLQE